MAGVVGRKLVSSFARSSTWGTPATVTRQILLTSTDGMDAMVSIVDDESFSQSFLAAGDASDQLPPTPELTLQARYEDIDSFLAAAMGSAAAPVAVSSQGHASSLAAFRHDITLAVELTHFWTVAVDMVRYVLEIPTLKIRGYNMRVGENGRMMVAFQTTGAKTNYDSVVNTNSVVNSARAPSFGNRMFRKDGRWRMNVQSAGALGASDVLDIIKEISLGTARPVADDDFVFNQDYIIEPDDNGYPDFPVEVTYARMSTPAANSLVVGLKAARVFKADWLFTGPAINTITNRTMLWEFPALQLRSIKIAAAGVDQVRPQATFKATLASAAPTGMSGLTNPTRLTIVNMNSQNLLA